MGKESQPVGDARRNVSIGSVKVNAEANAQATAKAVGEAGAGMEASTMGSAVSCGDVEQMVEQDPTLVPTGPSALLVEPDIPG